MSVLNNFNGFVKAPAEFDYSQKKKRQERQCIEELTAAFLEAGHKIKQYDNSGKVKMVGNWEATSAVKLNALGSKRKPDTQLDVIEFNKTEIRVFTNPKGQHELILKDVGLSLGMTHSFPLRFNAVKKTRKIRTNGVNRTLSTAFSDDIRNVVEKIPDKVIDPALRTCFVEWLEHQANTKAA